MTNTEALHKFWNSFGVPAFAENTVPKNQETPYITYQVVISDFVSGSVSSTVNLWWYTDSEAKVNAKAREIADRLGFGGYLVKFDGGCIWLKKGTPFCQSITNPEDHFDKRRYMNVTVDYLSN